jgi:hypothetical protein
MIGFGVYSVIKDISASRRFDMGKSYRLVIAIGLLICLLAIPPVNAQWIIDGVGICTETGDQTYVAIVSDSLGGAIMAWQDTRSGNADIYTQRIDASGHALWATGGVAVCTATGNQTVPQLINDGTGGAIITWGDYRSLAGYDVYARRVDADGNVLWADNGVAISTGTGNQQTPHIVPDGVGGAIITWYDTRGADGDVYAQRVDSSGNTLWTLNGVPICTYTGNQYMPQITADGTGAAVIAWRDIRNDLGDIYAQKIDTTGTVQWTADGVAVCTATNTQVGVKLTADGAGGMILAWYDERGATTDLYAQRLNGSGTAQWTADGVGICTAAEDQYIFGLVTDGSSGGICVWRDERNLLSTSHDIYVQRFDSDGTMLWTADGVAVCTAANFQYDPQIVSDSLGGAVVSWFDYRDNSHYDVYAQRVNATGDIQWTEDGIEVSTASGDQRDQYMTTDGAGGAIIAWQDRRSGTYDVYANRIDANGNAPPQATLLQSFAASSGEGGITINWTLSEAGKNMEFIVLRSLDDGMFERMDDVDISRDRLFFSFTDGTCEPGTAYRYRIDVRDDEGYRTLFETEFISTPALTLTLYQNYPNPFNPATMIRYHLPEDCRISLMVYDAAGRKIKCLLKRNQTKGRHAVGWDGHNDEGIPVSSGVYFYKLTAGKRVLTRKMVLLQ